MTDDGAAAREFHEATKHSLASLQREPHRLDWENQPMPFKLYEEAFPEEPLPLPGAPGTAPALRTLLEPAAPKSASERLDREALARLLFHSLGIVRRRTLGAGRTFGFRAAPCTGALYHVDAYLVCGELPSLAAGVYHFGPHDFRLRRLRPGDHRRALLAAGEAQAAAVAVVLASTWWRNAWKYRARAYRHVGWDGGAIVAQLCAEAAAERWPSRVDVGFVDEAVERLCGLDRAREGAAAIVWVGEPAAVPESPASSPLRLAVKPPSAREISYPEIAEVHDASRLRDADGVVAWRRAAPRTKPAAVAGPLVELAPDPSGNDEPLESVVRRRGSTRSFALRAIAKTALANLLAASSAPLAADYRSAPGSSLVDLFVIVHAVEGVPAGCYRWRPESSALERLSLGDRRRDAGFLALGQDLAADAAVNVYAIADLDSVLGSLGSRGYRAAMLEGGIAGGRIYLAAYGQGFGATGLTFFDDDVARLFGLDSRRFAIAFLVAAGYGSRR